MIARLQNNAHHAALNLQRFNGFTVVTNGPAAIVGNGQEENLFPVNRDGKRKIIVFRKGCDLCVNRCPVLDLILQTLIVVVRKNQFIVPVDDRLAVTACLDG